MSKLLNKIALWLVIVGAINWGLALFDVNIVTALFSSIPLLVKVIYGAVGVSGLVAGYNALK